MTKEQDIVVRKNVECGMKKIVDENETLAPTPSLSDDESHQNSLSTNLQQFYARKNILITGGTGKNTQSIITKFPFNEKFEFSSS